MNSHSWARNQSWNRFESGQLNKKIDFKSKSISPKSKRNIFGDMFFGAWGRDAPSAKGDPSCEGGIGTAGDVGLRPEGHMAMIPLVLLAFAGFCQVGLLTFNCKNLSLTCFLLAKRLRLPQVAMECHERIHTGCLWELWRESLTWRWRSSWHGWICWILSFWHQTKHQKKIQAKDVQSASSRSLF